MPQPSPETSSPKSKHARKGTAEAASSAAASAFAATSGLSFSERQAQPADQQGRRRLTDSYLIERSRIVPDPNQPRKEFDEEELTELTASIQARGIKQPLTVRWNPDIGRYMVIDGGRRFEAATRLQLEELPCWVQQSEGKELLIDQIVHNWQRSSLRPYETADALVRLRDEFEMSQKEMAAVTGKSKSEISKLLALKDKVAAELQEIARTDSESGMTKRHLYQISQLDKKEQMQVAADVQRDRLSADETEAVVQQRKGNRKTRIGGERSKGIAARQKRFRTSEADVLITFQKTKFTQEDILMVISELRQLADIDKQ
ncbi:MAG: ParB/RepB/Spo0J family partition protein [Fuerstiella sp.]